ncbi:MAG: helix-turn-helix domain-containing protein [Saccharolobus sp.]
MIKKYTLLLTHDDWSILTDKYSEEELKVIMETRTPLLESRVENIIANVHASDTTILDELTNKIIKTNNRITKIRILEKIRSKNETRALLLLSAKLRGGISEVIMNGGAYHYSEYVSMGREKWSIISDERTFRQIMLPNLKEIAYSLKIIKEDMISVKNVLTSKEAEVVYKAYKLGYFSWPKGIDLDELSQEIGISKAATLQTLRRALNKLIRNYISNTIDRNK